MSQAQKILKMIESVDPSDTDTLDEIDARVFYYLAEDDPDAFWDDNGKLTPAFRDDLNKGVPFTPHTRSRDALKTIRPEGWLSGFVQYPTGYKYIIEHKDSGLVIRGREMPTEELAELHAIIQAIEWERSDEQEI